jgi:hypothetical protein
MGVDLMSEDEILSCEWRTVLPREVRAEAVGGLHASIREDLPAGRVELWQGLREVRVEIAVTIAEGEARVEQARHGGAGEPEGAERP